MDSKEEWDGLDAVSKWLIVICFVVIIVIFYFCGIGGLLVLRDGYFLDNWVMFIVIWLIVIIGLFIVYGMNNFFNDYIDFLWGIDIDNYFCI